ncbi:hypothetical protein ACFQOY_10020 [Enterococcus alcedinis]|uniref:Uncharacterized protein n=1 Tax=Enterococcus alcedinis TaxID=1274384 RepID=A0A917N4I0_9ENTE|nr:hypothetical protein [Enterococcus alcedinis]MBP2102081.1 hypothetical protein [Enterococcus alcedinis]GGI65643.1 hypothetical protein GCM10011482_12970 [Enterococcus alcedinis]
MRVNKYEVVQLSEIIGNLASIIKEGTPEIGKKNLRKSIRDQFSNFVEPSFLCGNNLSMVKFLKEDAINKEMRHETRTYLIYKDENWEDLYGFFTISLKDLDISAVENPIKKELIFSGKAPANINFAPAYLISHVAKNDRFKTEFSGDAILLEALRVIEDIRYSIGGKLIFLDSVACEKIMDWYMSFGFKKFGEMIYSRDKEKLQPMIMTIDEDYK